MDYGMTNTLYYVFFAQYGYNLALYQCEIYNKILNISTFI